MTDKMYKEAVVRRGQTMTKRKARGMVTYVMVKVVFAKTNARGEHASMGQWVPEDCLENFLKEQCEKWSEVKL